MRISRRETTQAFEEASSGTAFEHARKRVARLGYAVAGVLFILVLAGAYILWSALPFLESNTALTLGVAALFAALALAFLWGLVLLISSAKKALFTAGHIIELLRESKKHIEFAISGSNEGLWDWNLGNNTVYFSSSWRRMLGFDEDDEIGTVSFWREHIHPDDRELVREALDRHLEGRASQYTVEYRMQNKYGTYRWVSDRGHVMYDDAENPIRIAGSTRDISNMKEVEEVLKGRTQELEQAKKRVEEEVRNAKKFEQAVEAATDAISIMDPQGKLVYVNPAWERLTGYKSAEAADFAFIDLFNEHTPHGVLEHMWDTLRSGKTFTSEEAVGRRRDGSMYKAELSVFPLMESGDIVFYPAVQQDITKRKEVDEAKTEFVSLASHQLRTPLSAIRWYAEMLLDEADETLTKKQKKYFREVYEANKHMIELVGALLNVSRIDLGKFAIDPEETNITAISESVLKEMQPLIAEKKTSVETTYDPDVPEISVDPDLMRIVFQNLLSNAVKYTPEGGRVRVRIERKDPNVVFSVEDNGFGIPPHQHDKIFTKLFRADNVREKSSSGTGLGLYIVKAIVEKSGGTIGFESPTIPGKDGEEGRGTRFYGTIPLAGSPQKGGTKHLDANPV